MKKVFTLIKALITKIILPLLLVTTVLLGMIPSVVKASPSEFDGGSEIISQRQENSKTFDLGDGTRQLHVSMGAIHYKDDYADPQDKWKDIDLTWEGNRITKAPYELTLEGNKVTIRDKKTGEISTAELLEIGGMIVTTKTLSTITVYNVALDTDIEIVAESGRVSLTRILKSDKAPIEAKFEVTGNWVARASDIDGEIPTESTLKDGVLTETLNPDRPIKYPVRIDPTWQVATATDDCSLNEIISFATNVQWLGVGNDATEIYFTWIGGAARFSNVNLPAEMTITGAVLVLTCGKSKAQVTVNSRIRAELSTSPATFSNRANFDARTWTTEFIRWDGIAAWVLNTEYTSPDFASVIQEVADLGAITHLSIFWDDLEQRSTAVADTIRIAWTYDASPVKAPKLVITYTVPPPVSIFSYLIPFLVSLGVVIIVLKHTNGSAGSFVFAIGAGLTIYIMVLELVKNGLI